MQWWIHTMLRPAAPASGWGFSMAWDEVLYPFFTFIILQIG